MKTKSKRLLPSILTSKRVKWKFPFVKYITLSERI